MNNIVIGMLAHVDAGKTTLSEALLYSTGTIKNLGRVDTKNAFLDTDAMERARGITIFSKQAQLPQLRSKDFGNSDFSVTLLDTPGHVDFSSEMERTLSVLDYAILVISAPEGVQSHTRTLWNLLLRYNIPTFIFVNKTDMQGTDLNGIMAELRSLLSESVIDFSAGSNIDMEDVALSDENILEKHLNGEVITDDDIAALIAERKIFPCFFGSALKLNGINGFINALSTYLRPKNYPDGVSARIFKITHDDRGNRLTHMKITGGTLYARMSLTENDEKINQIRIYSGEKFTAVNEISAGGICAVTGLSSTFAGQILGEKNASPILPFLEPVLSYTLIFSYGTDPLLALPKLKLLEEEDPQLHIVWNEFLKEIQLQFMGAVQLEVLKDIIKKRFNMDVTFGTGNIVYKETIKNTVEGVGHFEPLRHYAEVHLILEPGRHGSGIIIKNDCSENELDKNWQRLIMTHLHERTHLGVLTGSPLTDMVITLVGGRAHKKHTEGGDFRQASYRAVRQGVMQAESVLLEPYYDFTLEIPHENVGRIMTTLEKMHAQFELISSGSGVLSVITGNVSVAAFLECQTEFMAYVASASNGKGKIFLQQGTYRPCHNEEEVISKINYDCESDVLNPSSSVFCAHGSGFIVPWNEVFEHMHIESILKERMKKSDGVSQNLKNNVSEKSPLQKEPRFLGTEEVDAILRDTYYANSKNKNNPFSKSKDDGSKTYVYKGKETVQNKGTYYMLVDGYNIIFSWEELKELAKDSLDAARGRLLDIMCDYQAMKKCELIVVFDAYRVQNHSSETLDYHNIHVVYTKEAETADSYIEKFAHDYGSKYYVRVATSDRLEQIIIIGQGCHTVSSKEFEAEVLQLKKQLRDEYLNRNI